METLTHSYTIHNTQYTNTNTNTQTQIHKHKHKHKTKQNKTKQNNTSSTNKPLETQLKTNNHHQQRCHPQLSCWLWSSLGSPSLRQLMLPIFKSNQMLDVASIFTMCVVWWKLWDGAWIEDVGCVEFVVETCAGIIPRLFLLNLGSDCYSGWLVDWMCVRGVVDGGGWWFAGGWKWCTHCKMESWTFPQYHFWFVHLPLANTLIRTSRHNRIYVCLYHSFFFVCRYGCTWLSIVLSVEWLWWRQPCEFSFFSIQIQLGPPNSQLYFSDLWWFGVGVVNEMVGDW